MSNECVECGRNVGEVCRNCCERHDRWADERVAMYGNETARLAIASLDTTNDLCVKAIELTEERDKLRQALKRLLFGLAGPADDAGMHQAFHSKEAVAAARAALGESP